MALEVTDHVSSPDRRGGAVTPEVPAPRTPAAIRRFYSGTHPLAPIVERARSQWPSLTAAELLVILHNYPGGGLEGVTLEHLEEQLKHLERRTDDKTGIALQHATRASSALGAKGLSARQTTFPAERPAPTPAAAAATGASTIAPPPPAPALPERRTTTPAPVEDAPADLTRLIAALEKEPILAQVVHDLLRFVPDITATDPEGTVARVLRAYPGGGWTLAPRADIVKALQLAHTWMSNGRGPGQLGPRAQTLDARDAQYDLQISMIN